LIFCVLNICHIKTDSIIIFGNNIIIKALVAVPGIEKFGARYLMKHEITAEINKTFDTKINWFFISCTVIQPYKGRVDTNSTSRQNSTINYVS